MRNERVAGDAEEDQCKEREESEYHESQGSSCEFNIHDLEMIYTTYLKINNETVEYR
jgi:hypothetical protein